MFINNFDPVAIQFFSIEIRWYSLAYIVGILLGWILSKKIFISDAKLNEKFDDYIAYLKQILNFSCIYLICYYNYNL